MTAGEYIDILIFIFGLLMSIIGYLISNKVAKLEAKQDHQDTLHNLDVAALAELRVLIAQQHPTKDDIKDIMENLKTYLDERFNNVEQIARYSSGNNRNHKENS